jgi:hypothetical protein
MPVPGAEDQTADCKVHEWPAHVDQDERPLVRFEGGENCDRRVFDEKKGEPAQQRDFQTGNCVRGIHASDQPGQCIIDNNRRNNRQKVSAYAVSALDIGHCAGVKVEPLLAKNCVPTPTNELVHDNQNPNGEMIDLVVHETLRDYAGVRSSIANRFLC